MTPLLKNLSMRFRTKFLYTLILLAGFGILSLSTKVAAQQLPAAISQKLETLSANHQQEQQFEVWIETDQPYYMPSDTMHLEVYVFSRAAKTNRFDGQVWVDLVNRDNEIKRHLLLSVTGGKASTQIVFSNLEPGYYLLTGYTKELARLGPDASATGMNSVGITRPRSG